MLRSKRPAPPWSRWSLLGPQLVLSTLACLVTIATGVRVDRSHAGPWTEGRFGGGARAALSVDHDPSLQFGILDVFAVGSFTTELSVFDAGLTVRTPFIIPGGLKGVLLLDLTRIEGSQQWTGSDNARIRARYYIYAPTSGDLIYDGVNVDGSVNAEARVMTAGSLGFRLTGWLDTADVGPDGLPDTEDDRRVTIQLDIESRPSPKPLTGSHDGTVPMPIVERCDPADCYYDPAYDHLPGLVVGCDSGTTTYEDEAAGCGSDTGNDESVDFDEYGNLIDGSGEPGYTDDDPFGGYEDEYDYDDVGCGGQDTEWDDSASSSGCDSTSDTSDGGCEGDTWDDDADSADGCGSDSSGDSGCGDSDGCEGDNYTSMAGPPIPPGGKNIPWWIFLGLAVFVVTIHDSRSYESEEADDAR